MPPSAIFTFSSCALTWSPHLQCSEMHALDWTYRRLLPRTWQVYPISCFHVQRLCYAHLCALRSRTNPCIFSTRERNNRVQYIGRRALLKEHGSPDSISGVLTPADPSTPPAAPRRQVASKHHPEQPAIAWAPCFLLPAAPPSPAPRSACMKQSGLSLRFGSENARFGLEQGVQPFMYRFQPVYQPSGGYHPLLYFADGEYHQRR